jgi:cytochrome c556
MKNSPFLPLGRRAPSFEQGYRAALADCTAWLMARAGEMDAGRLSRDARAVRKAAHDMSTEAKAVTDLWSQDSDQELP